MKWQGKFCNNFANINVDIFGHFNRLDLDYLNYISKMKAW